MEDDGSLDVQTLQAQIDMSMAFAQEMVSSWVKPSRKIKRSTRDYEAELKEYMRRPLRLGVGAPIPETATSSRDAARLKGQLVGKNNNKRPREEDDASKDKDISDNEGESRGGAIKKVARVDPFTIKSKKNKTTITQGSTSAEPLVIKEPEKVEEPHKVENMLIDKPSTPSTSPKKKKHKKKHSSSLSVFATQLSPSPSSPVSTVVNVDHHGKPNVLPPVVAYYGILSNSVEPNQSSEDVDGLLTPHRESPFQLRRQAQTAALLQHPLLNLTPTNGDDSEDEEHVGELKSNTVEGSHKKRRKRKKRKRKGDTNTLPSAQP
ncbi:hypothetical protein H0H93_000059 [Arthromyces matolae]|nr:hypothetical protein H0H93_000059 [Arthromyces matolae]